MRRLILTLGLLLVPALAASAQTVTPANSVAFEQSDYANVTRFEVRVDSGAWVDVGKPAATGTGNTVTIPMPAMTPGAHAITARACNAAGCSAASSALNVTMVAIPAVPTNLRATP